MAFDSYNQVLLDVDVEISTTNKFLKVMQIIEGMERNDISEEEQKKFDKDFERQTGYSIYKTIKFVQNSTKDRVRL